MGPGRPGVIFVSAIFAIRPLNACSMLYPGDRRNDSAPRALADEEAVAVIVRLSMLLRFWRSFAAGIANARMGGGRKGWPTKSLPGDDKTHELRIRSCRPKPDCIGTLHPGIANEFLSDVQRETGPKPLGVRLLSAQAPASAISFVRSSGNTLRKTS